MTLFFILWLFICILLQKRVTFFLQIYFVRSLLFSWLLIKKNHVFLSLSLFCFISGFKKIPLRLWWRSVRDAKHCIEKKMKMKEMKDWDISRLVAPLSSIATLENERGSRSGEMALRANISGRFSIDGWNKKCSM